MELKDKFKFTISNWYDRVYTAVRDGDKYVVTWDTTGRAEYNVDTFHKMFESTGTMAWRVVEEKEEEVVKLAEKFMFVSTDEGTTIYTAEETDTGDYRVSWLDDGHSNFKTLPYDRDTVYSNIVSGAWIVRQVFPKAEQPALKYVGREFYSTVNNAYSLRSHENGERYIVIGAGGKKYDFNYTEELVEQFIKDGMWKWKEPEVSLEPSDDVLVVWPFPVSTVVGANEGEPEFLPPDDIPDLVPESFSLAAVRKFFKDCPNYTFEVDEEFMVVKPVQPSQYGSTVYVAKTEVELEKIFEAIRTLERFVDRG